MRRAERATREPVNIFKRDRWSIHWGVILAALAGYGLASILHDQSFW